MPVVPSLRVVESPPVLESRRGMSPDCRSALLSRRQAWGHPIRSGAAVRQGRSSGYLLGAEFAYEALDLRTARRYVGRGLRLYPQHASRRWLSLAAKTLLPAPVVRRLRSRRR